MSTPLKNDFNNKPSLQPVDPNFFTPITFNLPVATVTSGDPATLINSNPMVPVGSDPFIASSPLFSSSPQLVHQQPVPQLIAVNSDNTAPNMASVSPLTMFGYVSNSGGPGPQYVGASPSNLTPGHVFPMGVYTTPSPNNVYQIPSPNNVFRIPSPNGFPTAHSPVFLASSPDLPQVFAQGLFPPSPTQIAYRSTTPEQHLPVLSPPYPSHQIQQNMLQPQYKADPTRTAYKNVQYQEHRGQTPVRGGPENGEKGQRQKKFAYRSKQRKIQKVHRNIKEHFTNLGLFAEEKELVRGDDTLRIHVKTFDGLSDIQSALMEIQNNPEMEIKRIAAVFSKKNKYQKKGFITYLKLGSVEQRQFCQRLLAQYHTNLKNVAVARKREDAKPIMEAGSEAEKSQDDFPRLPRQNTASAM